MVTSRSDRRVWLACSLGALLLGTVSYAADSGPRSETRVASIIDRLSGPSFQDRLNAEDEALQSGDSVLPELLKAESSQDPELRLRARQLIQRIEQDGLLQSMNAFLAPNSLAELPGWSVVADVVGDTPENRKYYADLLTAEPLLTQALRRPERLAGELSRRQQEYGQAMLGGASSQSPMRTAALMLLLLHPDLDAPDQARNDASRMVMYGIAVGGASVGDRFIEALAVQWVASPRPGTAHQRFELAWRLNRSEMVVPALEMLRQRPIPAQSAPYFAMLARYGGPEEMAELESLLGDVTEQWSHERDDNSKTQTQVRDLALAALIEMTQQKAEDYGLKPFDRDGNRRLRALRPVFETSDARDIALEKWKTWSAQNLKKYRPFPGIAMEGVTL